MEPVKHLTSLSVLNMQELPANEKHLIYFMALSRGFLGSCVI